MKAGKILCLLVIVVATVHFALAVAATGTGAGLGLDAFLRGYFSNRWQAVIDVDLMLGLLLAVAWIGWRESDRLVAFTWIIVLLWWGNLILAIYVYRQLARSRGDWAVFFMGDKAPGAAALQKEAVAWPASVRDALYLTAAALAAFVVAGCWITHFALVPAIGYVSGVGSLALAAAVTASKHGPSVMVGIPP